jgi:sigma-B regulation protein RsbU (phosphoserine phosphatase)
MNEIAESGRSPLAWSLRLSMSKRAQRWLRIELAFMLTPVLVVLLLSDKPLALRGMLVYTFLLGSWAAVLVQVTQGWFRPRPSPWDRIGFYCLAFIGAVTPDLVSGFVDAMADFSPAAGHSAAFNSLHRAVDVSMALGAATPLERLVAPLLVILILAAFYEKDRMDERHRELMGQVTLGKVREQSAEAELSQAHEIQRHLLPRDTPQIPGFQIACAWQPAKSVSGDYFDVLPLGPGQMGLCIADVAGKGIAAALLMANLQASVRAFAPAASSPAMLCAKLNSVLCETVAPGKFVTLFYAVIDTKLKQIRYENAGHCLPLIVRADGSVLLPESYSGVLGLFAHWTYRDSVLQVERGDCLVLLTDGVLEAANADEEEFGYLRLIDVVTRNRGAGVDRIRSAILEAVSAFCNGKFDDDASLVVVTVD